MYPMLLLAAIECKIPQSDVYTHPQRFALILESEQMSNKRVCYLDGLNGPDRRIIGYLEEDIGKDVGIPRTIHLHIQSERSARIQTVHDVLSIPALTAQYSAKSLRRVVVV